MLLSFQNKPKGPILSLATSLKQIEAASVVFGASARPAETSNQFRALAIWPMNTIEYWNNTYYYDSYDTVN